MTPLPLRSAGISILGIVNPPCPALISQNVRGAPVAVFFSAVNPAAFPSRPPPVKLVTVERRPALVSCTLPPPSPSLSPIEPKLVSGLVPPPVNPPSKLFPAEPVPPRADVSSPVNEPVPVPDKKLAASAESFAIPAFIELTSMS